MPRRELVAAFEDGEDYLNIVDKDETSFDRYEDLPAGITLEKWADTGDHDAENRNNHSYVGAHKILSALLCRNLGRTIATNIMREIIIYGGIDGMNGCGGEDDAFADFGLVDDGREWQIEEPDATPCP